MRITISVLLIMQPNTLWNDLFHEVYNIRLYRIIPVFLNHDTSSGATYINIHQSGGKTSAFYYCFNFAGNIIQTLAGFCFALNDSLHKRFFENYKNEG